MTEGNWPDPSRPGEPKDANEAADYYLSNGPFGKPKIYSWVPAKRTTSAYWYRLDHSDGTEGPTFTVNAATEALYFIGQVR